MVWDLLLVMALGFLGSFGHCVSMCGPLTVAFSLAQAQQGRQKWRSLVTHFGFNVGRLLSYGLVGAALGAAGSVVMGGGQLVGIGSSLRQGVSVLAGLVLIWAGLVQMQWVARVRLPLLEHWSNQQHGLLQQLTARFTRLSTRWQPLVLGSLWGLMPCGFLYIAQIKAAETGDWRLGFLTLWAFGLGTVPSMMGVGVLAEKLGGDRRSQLFRLSGVLMLGIGVLALLRTDAMVDYSGYLALGFLMLALLARPLSGLWPQLLQSRRLLGVSSLALALAHTGAMVSHSLNWNLAATQFMLPQHQIGLWLGGSALLCLLPAGCTSFDCWQQRLGRHWRTLHLLSIPALICGVLHTLLLGSRYLGGFTLSVNHWMQTFGLGSLALLVLLIRQRWLWSLLALQRFYTAPHRSVLSPPSSHADSN